MQQLLNIDGLMRWKSLYFHDQALLVGGRHETGQQRQHLQRKNISRLALGSLEAGECNENNTTVCAHIWYTRATEIQAQLHDLLNKYIWLDKTRWLLKNSQLPTKTATYCRLHFALEIARLAADAVIHLTKQSMVNFQHKQMTKGIIEKI